MVTVSLIGRLRSCVFTVFIYIPIQTRLCPSVPIYLKVNNTFEVNTLISILTIFYGPEDGSGPTLLRGV